MRISDWSSDVCSSDLQADDAATMSQLASELTYLSRSVDAQLLEEPAVSALSDNELLARSTEHDPALLSPFKEYELRVLRSGTAAALLVCTKDAARGVLEDAGCTASLDNPLWKQPDAPCAFTINTSEVRSEEHTSEHQS